MKDRDVELSGTHLMGKNIAVIPSGSIAAYKVPSILRELRRYGADVTVFPTDEALRFITEDTLAWASDKNVVDRLSYKAEHVDDSIELYIVTPATLDIIGDLANAIAGKPAPSLLAAAFGKHKLEGIPIIVAPAMHEYLWNDPPFQRNLKYLEDHGIKVAGPRIIDGKANLEYTDNIVAYTIRELSEGPLKGKNFRVTTGPVKVKLDDVRSITNGATGELGIEIAKELYLQGAEVQLVHGDVIPEIPEWIDTVYAPFYDDMYKETIDEIDGYDVLIASAAIPDFKVENAVEGKIGSDQGLTIKLEPTDKIIGKAKDENMELFIVSFKLEDRTKKALDSGQKRLEDNHIVFANSLEEMNDAPPGIHPAYIMERDGDITRVNGTKTDDARVLVNLIENYYKDSGPQKSIFDYSKFNGVGIPVKAHKRSDEALQWLSEVD